MSSLQGAVETTAPVSRLHERRSYDPADFGVPTGREEESRFTPLRRLRGLHGDAPLPEGKVTVEADPAPEVTVDHAKRGDPRLARSFVPADRVSARAFASFTEATVFTVPAGAVASRPTVVTVRGEESTGAAFGHTLIQLEPNSSAVVVLDHQGSATYADNVELVVGDGAHLAVISLQDWADDAVHLSHHHARLGRDAQVSHESGAEHRVEVGPVGAAFLAQPVVSGPRRRRESGIRHDAGPLLLNQLHSVYRATDSVAQNRLGPVPAPGEGHRQSEERHDPGQHGRPDPGHARQRPAQQCPDGLRAARDRQVRAVHPA